MASVVLQDASVEFKFRTAYHIPIKEFVLQRLLRRGNEGRPKTVNALAGIDLRLTDGDRVGVIGHNGAGKSTLLRLLAGIYMPTSGVRDVRGKVSSLLDINVGIEPDASGWENIEFRGYLQRYTPEQLKQKIPEIAEFSELGTFLEAPVRCYSTGMQVRLAFSIATAIEPEILIIDEIFSAGDASFQAKATRRMRELMARSRIMVMASHDLVTLESLCNTVIWLDQGILRMHGAPSEVIAAYHSATQPTAAAA